MSSHEVIGVILAAGASSRFGSPKWQARIGGKTFLENIIGNLNSAGIHKIIVVFRDISSEIPPGIIPVMNPFPENGQLSSLKCALNAIPSESYFLMCLVDRPLVKSSIIAELSAVLNENTVIIPACDGKKGHPVLFPPGMKEIMLSTPDMLGIRETFRRWKGEIRLLPVQDPAILWNIDTPDDLVNIEKMLTSV